MPVSNTTMRWLRAGGCLSLVASLAGAASIAAQAPPPPPQVPGPMTGLSAISVQVVADATGRPVKGAAVLAIVVAETATYTKQTLTDRNGRALLLGLAKGRVRLSVTHQAYLNATYGQERPDDAGTFMPIGAEQTIGPITIRMKRGATIAGILTNETGEPMVGMYVQAFRRGFSSGRQMFLGAGFGVTDDRGAYRISNLLAGEYLVGFVPHYFGSAAGSDALWDPNDADSGVEFSSRLAFEPALVLADGRKVALDSRAPLPGSTSTDGLFHGYAATYYPGTGANEAVAVKIDAAELRRNIDFVVASAPVVTVAGTAATPEGARLPGTAVLIPAAPSDRIGLVEPFVSLMPPSGEFSFPFVPRGQYRLELRTQESEQHEVKWGLTTLVVGDQPIRDLSVTLQPGARLSGRLNHASDDVEAMVRTLKDVRLMLTLRPSALGSSTHFESVKPDGGFAFDRLVPGAYTLSVDGLPHGWFASSAMFNGRDLFDFGLRIEPGQDLENVVVTVTDRMAELTGVLRDAAGTPASSGYVVVFPADRAFWTGSSRRVQATRPDTDGRYAFLRTLPPGDYLLAAADLEPGSWQDPAVLAGLEARAIRVRLVGNEKVVRDLRR